MSPTLSPPTSDPAVNVSLTRSSGRMTVKTPASSQEILRELRNFVNGVTFVSKVSRPELARSAMFLLQTLPSAREAVLEYMCVVFDDAVNAHTIGLELQLEMQPAASSSAVTSTSTSTSTSNIVGGTSSSTVACSSVLSENDNGIIQDVEDVLTSFIHANPEGWAPIVSTWSLELLGQLSSKYSDRRGLLHASNLNEILQLWMGCRPTRSLIDLSTLCISTLIGGNPDRCIAALLDTSVQHSPHFDWVVAHIGSCFPNTVITRVLACGLRDFYSHGDQSQTESAVAGATQLPTPPDKKVPKMASVVGILGHLAGQHTEDIRKALLSLFQESLIDSPSIQQLATVPFLLQLSSMSSMLRRVTTVDFVKTLSPDVINRICRHVPAWCQLTGQNGDDLMSLAVHLILKSEEGGQQIIEFLLDMALTSSTPNVDVTDRRGYLPQAQSVAGRILDFLLFEIQCLVNSKSSSSQVDVPILQTLHRSVPMLCGHLLATHAPYWPIKLLSCLAVYGKESKASEIIVHVLTNAVDARQLGLVERLVSLVEPWAPVDLLEVAIRSVFTERKSRGEPCPLQLLKNLLCLVRWETEGLKSQSNFTLCLQKFFQLLAAQIGHPDDEAAHCAMEILGHVPLPDSLPMTVLVKLSTSAIVYFFVVIQSADSSKISKIATHRKLISRLCEHHSIQQLVLRSLLEGALDARHASHFGSSSGCRTSISDAIIEVCNVDHFSLTRENQKHAVSVTLPQSHATVFHAGIIGRGLQPPKKPFNLSASDRFVNVQLLLEMIKAACVPCRCTPDKYVQGPVPTAEGMTTVALLLVELVSSDVMFNGLPWPDEEFAKVTIERDLHINRMFQDNPVLWDLVYLVATFRPTLCYCSVLLRALAAVHMSFWAGCHQERASVNCPKQLDTTCHLFNAMAIGQILPPPLSHIGEILRHVTPHEVYVLLVDTWKYMKENVPSPAAFTSRDHQGYPFRDFDASCDFKYVNRLHCILQNNMAKFGHVFTHFFSCESTEETQKLKIELNELQH